jgi:hypothetical protein
VFGDEDEGEPGGETDQPPAAGNGSAPAISGTPGA